MDNFHKLIFATLLIGVSTQLKAQLNYTFSSSNSALVYNSGTTLTFGNNDDAYSSVQSIGFTFSYGCVNYTQFQVSTNGWIGLGSNINNDLNTNNLGGTNSWPIIAPLWDDLAIGTGGNINFKMTGTSPNRVLTVEWYKMNWNYNASSPVITFQAILTETSNTIEFIYKSEGGTNTSNGASIGFNNLGVDYYAMYGTSATAPCYYKFDRGIWTTAPADGQHFLWTPPVGNMSYVSSNTIQYNSGVTVSKCTLDQPILQIQVVTSGYCSALSVTQIKINMTGSTIPGNNTNDVTKVHVYYSGTTPNFNKMVELGSGGQTPNTGVMTFTGTATLNTGTNYFWVAYDINPVSATVANVLDAQCTQITVGGSNKTPTTQNPAGSRAIAACAASPGGISTGLAFWIKSNAGTSSTTDNTLISAWNDQSGNARHASQATAANQPKYYDNATNNLNFNPVVDFDEAGQAAANGDYMDITSNNILPSGNEAYTVYSVLLPGPNNSSAPGKFLFSGTGVNTFCAFDIRSGGTINDSWDLNDLLVGSQWTSGSSLLTTFDFNYAQRTMLVSGNVVGTKNVANRASINTNSAIGCQTAVNPHIEFYDGSMAEIITYPNISHSQNERYRVESYLATKYGVTLTHNYYSSIGTVVWDITTNGSYNTNIIGIGRDDNSVLSQKQSKSTSASKDIQTISIGPSLQVNQKNNTGTVLAGDQSFFYSGSNGGAATFAASAQLPSGYTQKLGRQWLSQKTNFTNNDMTFTFDMSGVGAYTNSYVAFLVDNDGDFTNAIFPSSTTLSFSGSTLTVVTKASNFVATPYYTLAISSTPLPVSFFNIEAVMNQGIVEISWSTTTEKNNEYFIVERSADGTHFESVTKVKGNGNTNIVSNYQANDNHAYPGTSYYRIKQVDSDEKYSYSKIIVVNKEFNKKIELLPNPVTNENISSLGISGLEKGSEILFALYDIHGNELFSKIAVVGITDKTVIGIDPSINLSPGLYFITATSEQDSYKLKFIITEK